SCSNLRLPARSRPVLFVAGIVLCWRATGRGRRILPVFASSSASYNSRTHADTSSGSGPDARGPTAGEKESVMAPDRSEARESYWSQRFPWLVLFRGFRLAFDFNKLVLAVGGLLVMALVWWLLASAFFAVAGEQPEFNERLKNVQFLPEADENKK